MDFKAHFHTNYTSSGVGGTYTKISVELDGCGMFCVIRNKTTGMIQRQVYMSGNYDARNYVGLYSNDGYFDGVVSLKYAWSGISDEDKTGILNCVNYLSSAFKRFCKKYYEVCGTPAWNENDVYAYLNALRQELCAMNGNATMTEEERVSCIEENMGEIKDRISYDWGAVRLNSLSSNDLRNIMDRINDRCNPDDGVEYNGNKYRVMNDENGKMVLRVLQSNFSVKSVADTNGVKQPKPVATTPPKLKRRTKRMAFMRDNTNLTEFVNGCYYKIVKEINSEFIAILNDANEERTVSRSRVSLLDVYDQPPFEEEMANEEPPCHPLF